MGSQIGEKLVSGLHYAHDVCSIRDVPDLLINSDLIK